MSALATSDLVFKIDQFQANPANIRVMCPEAPSHGPMFVHGTGGKMLCNEPRCRVEIGIPSGLVAELTQ